MHTHRIPIALQYQYSTSTATILNADGSVAGSCTDINSVAEFFSLVRVLGIAIGPGPASTYYGSVAQFIVYKGIFR